MLEGTSSVYRAEDAAGDCLAVRNIHRRAFMIRPHTTDFAPGDKITFWGLVSSEEAAEWLSLPKDERRQPVRFTVLSISFTGQVCLRHENEEYRDRDGDRSLISVGLRELGLMLDQGIMQMGWPS